MNYPIDPKLDLVLERVVDAPRELLWKAWTTPEHLKPWFCPKPWETVECEIDLRPGGIFYTKMRGPEGQEFPGTGCYLEIVPNERLVWTGALLPHYRPQAVPEGVPVFTAVLTFEPHPQGTKYTAHVMHKDEAARAAHDAMGFHTGWGKALDQLVEFVKAW